MSSTIDSNSTNDDKPCRIEPPDPYEVGLIIGRIGFAATWITITYLVGVLGIWWNL